MRAGNLAVALVAALAGAIHAQDCKGSDEIRPAALNLNFAEGTPGMRPPGWYLGPEDFLRPHQPVYQAQTAAGGACVAGPQCATVRSLRADPKTALAFLLQVVDAAAYRGRTFFFRAMVRAEVPGGSMARLLVRVHRRDCSTSFFDNLGDHPITASIWSPYQIQAPVGADAHDVEFGMQLIGQGQAWIDRVSVEAVR